MTRRSIYEFIQRRSDWKKIEKTVDKVRSAGQVADWRARADQPHGIARQCTRYR